MPKGRLVFDGDNIYTEKDARIYKLKTSVSSKIDAIPWVVDSLDSTSATDALSANMGRQLQDQINSLSWTWKFLSTWDCTTWLPGTNPQEDPYTYKAWDYYVVSTVGSTNYKPHWGTYTQWVPSTTVETENVWTNDKYYFDGADWVRIPDTAIQIWIDSALSTTSTNAVENRAIANAINTKQNIIPDLNDIRSWATAWATALQALDNITELTNNIWYQTAGDVASAIQTAIWQLPTVNDWVLTIQKNNTTIDTFSANSASNKTINIPVPTTVAELSDANNYATKTDLNNAIDSLIHEWSTAPQNPQEWDMWYDTVNHVLKIYNWTTWETVDTDTDTTYTAWNGINISAQHEISVDTSVVATKEYVDDKMSSWSTAPTNPVEWQIWYDVTNHILKIYNWTNRVPVDTNTTYSAWTYLTLTWTTFDVDTSTIATKTYVDDEIAESISSWSTAPSNPVTWQLWYDTTNNILMVYDWTNWVEVSSSSISDAAFSSSWDGDTTHAPSKNAIYDVLGDVETLLANL